MKTILLFPLPVTNGILLLCSTFYLVASGQAQDSEAVVKKESLSIHRVERGSMPLLAPASGSLISAEPEGAILTFERIDARCEPGRNARLVVGEIPKAFAGRVVRRIEGNSGVDQCEVEFVDGLPEGAAAGIKVGGLIEIGQLQNVVFFGRPAHSLPNSTSTIFVLDEKTSSARRVTVRYGEISGPLIQVLDGLSPGDKVIVTDMSKWANVPRVRIE